MSKFVFTGAALAAAGLLMQFNAESIAKGCEALGPEFEERGVGLYQALRNLCPEGVEDVENWCAECCEQVDPEGWAQLQEANRVEFERREAEAARKRERGRRIAAAIAKAAGDCPPFLVQIAVELGQLGVVPGPTTAIEVEGAGTVHVYGLDNLRALASGACEAN